MTTTNIAQRGGGGGGGGGPGVAHTFLIFYQAFLSISRVDKEVIGSTTCMYTMAITNVNSMAQKGGE